MSKPCPDGAVYALVVSLLLLTHGRSDENTTPDDCIPIPPELSGIEVDVDGDGVATYADKLTLALWTNMGGDIVSALEMGTCNEAGVLDVSAFWRLAIDLASPVATSGSEEPLAFGDPVFYAVLNSTPHQVEAADLDGDGDLDLVLTETAENLIAVFMNDGNGAFAAPMRHAVGQGPRAVAIGDFNADTLPDIAVANTLSSDITVIYNNGSPNWSDARMPDPHAQYAVADSPRSVVAADMNRDGALDLAVGHFMSSTYCRISILPAGDFGHPNVVFEKHLPEAESSAFVMVGDIDKDSSELPDIVTSSGVTLLNQGNWLFIDTTLATMTGHPQEGALGDFDGDGDNDMASALYDGRAVVLFTNNGLGSFSRSDTINLGDPCFAAVATDLDGDEDLDVAVANFGSVRISGIFILRNKALDPPAGLIDQFQAATYDHFPLDHHPHSLRAADLDGDYRPDFVAPVINYTGTHGIEMRINQTVYAEFRRGDSNDDGRWDIGDAICILGYVTGQGPRPVCMESADVNGDGRVDIADPISFLSYLFAGGPPPIPPFPECDWSPRTGVGCAEYSSCG